MSDEGDGSMTIGQYASDAAKWLDPELGSVFSDEQKEDITVKAALYSVIYVRHSALNSGQDIIESIFNL